MNELKKRLNKIANALIELNPNPQIEAGIMLMKYKAIEVFELERKVMFADFPKKVAHITSGGDIVSTNWRNPDAVDKWYERWRLR